MKTFEITLIILVVVCYGCMFILVPTYYTGFRDKKAFKVMYYVMIAAFVAIIALSAIMMVAKDIINP